MPKIDAMFAFIAEDNGPEDEGIMGFSMPDGSMMPMVGADMKRVKSLLPMAKMIRRVTGKPFKILRFKIDGEIKFDE